MAWFFIYSYHDKLYMLNFEATVDSLSPILFFIYLLTSFLVLFPPKFQVNQKMMKSTLIKDLYGEIDRLKAGKSSWFTVTTHSCLKICAEEFSDFYFSELNATREKNGVYIPKERYSQEEGERKVIIYLTSVIMLTSMFIKQSIATPLIFSVATYWLVYIYSTGSYMV